MKAYQKVIYDMIDTQEEVKSYLSELPASANEDIVFSKDSNGSIIVCIKYKEYNVSINITQKEVFRYVWQEGKKPGEVIERLIKEKLFAVLS